MINWPEDAAVVGEGKAISEAVGILSAKSTAYELNGICFPWTQSASGNSSWDPHCTQKQRHLCGNLGHRHQ